MTRTVKLSLGFVTTILVLGGCATSQPVLQGQLDPNFGSAVKANTAMHAVAPTAAQKADTFIPADSTRTSQARQNYRENKVAEPKPIKSTSN